MLPKRIDIFGMPSTLQHNLHYINHLEEISFQLARCDVGKEHPMSYPEMKQIYGHIPPAALRALLEKELCTTQWSCRLLEGMSSVLNDGISIQDTFFKYAFRGVLHDTSFTA